MKFLPYYIYDKMELYVYQDIQNNCVDFEACTFIPKYCYDMSDGITLFNLATYYTTIDWNTCESYLYMAMDKKYTYAACALGILYDSNKSYELAEKYLLIASKHGILSAIKYLGMLYSEKSHLFLVSSENYLQYVHYAVKYNHKYCLGLICLHYLEKDDMTSFNFYLHKYVYLKSVTKITEKTDFLVANYKLINGIQLCFNVLKYAVLPKEEGVDLVDSIIFYMIKFDYYPLLLMKSLKKYCHFIPNYYKRILFIKCNKYSFNIFSLKIEHDLKSCNICMCNRYLTVTKCNHKLCRDCIEKISGIVCPFCRGCMV
jgi:hypothetical protein